MVATLIDLPDSTVIKGFSVTPSEAGGGGSLFSEVVSVLETIQYMAFFSPKGKLTIIDGAILPERNNYWDNSLRKTRKQLKNVQQARLGQCLGSPFTKKDYSVNQLHQRKLQESSAHAKTPRP